jgi:dynein heavy chain 2
MAGGGAGAEPGASKSGRNTTEVVEAVVWAVQALERVTLAVEVCGSLVGGGH